jgi:hypothetical protein
VLDNYISSTQLFHITDIPPWVAVEQQILKDARVTLVESFIARSIDTLKRNPLRQKTFLNEQFVYTEKFGLLDSIHPLLKKHMIEFKGASKK